MGYEAHLVKTADWLDEDNRFTKAEWDDILSKNPSVADRLYFDGRDVSGKNLNNEQIVAFVRIAKQLGWKVQGDESEEYAEDGSAIPDESTPPPAEFRNPITQWLSNRRKVKELKKDVGPPPFKVGDKVKPFWSESTGVVVSVDPNANHGAGRLVIRMESGREHEHMFFGHGFEKVE